MGEQPGMVWIPADQMQSRFESILLDLGFHGGRASELATGFTENSVDGVYTHGINRFARFVEYTREGIIRKNANPTLKSKSGAIEQWDGQLGPGITNARFATRQSMKLADEFGIGCVALANTNHWMRGGTYGWQAARSGYAFVGWTNTIANLPAWGAIDARLGNNPLVMALPFNEEAIVLDMAMSQYSFGAMELSAMKNEPLPVNAGFDSSGELSRDPKAILASRRPLPIGYWKGSGLSLLLDLLATILCSGLPTHEISRQQQEYGLSQVFISINLAGLPNHSTINQVLNEVITDYKGSIAQDAANPVTYPGERVLRTRRRNLEKGIPVMTKIWEEILSF